MPSPFPGMNPYLERAGIFNSFHQHFIPACMEALVTQIRPRYYAKLEEHIYIHELPADERRFIGRADLSVLDRSGEPKPERGVWTLQAPAYGTMPLAVDVERESYIEIVDRESRRVVTIVELLSPTNKYAGPDRGQYLNKRMQILRSAVNLVELDLLRGGPRLPGVDRESCAYVMMVSKWDELPKVGLWPLRLRDPLPSIPIPLRGDDQPATLPLQALLHRVYDAAGYEDFIYDGKPEPALSPEDDAWAQAILAAAGKS